MKTEDWMNNARSTFKKWASNRNINPDEYKKWVPGDHNVNDIEPLNPLRRDTIDWDWSDKDYKPNDISDKLKKKIKEVKKFRDVEPDDYFIITPKKIKEEVGDINEKILDRMSDIVLTCVNCGFRDLFVKFLGNTLMEDKGDLTCPNCDSKAVGMKEEKKHRWVEECLKGDVIDE